MNSSFNLIMTDLGHDFGEIETGENAEKPERSFSVKVGDGFMRIDQFRVSYCLFVSSLLVLPVLIFQCVTDYVWW